MIGKVIAYGDTREQAIARMRIALSEMVVEGIQTNIPLHQELLLDDALPARRHVDPLPRGEARAGAASRRRNALARGHARRSTAAHAERARDALLDAGAASVTSRSSGSRTARRPRREPGARCSRAARLDAVRRARRRAAATLPRLRCAPSRSASRARSPTRTGCARTQAQFGPIAHRRRLWIVPTWHEPPEPTRSCCGSIPGSRSAPASHPTTRSVPRLAGARRSRGGERVLDYGCGSGILAIAAAKLGARDVVGIDIDPQALGPRARERARRTASSCAFAAPDALALRRLRHRRREHPRRSR